LTLNLARAIHASNTASPNRIEDHTVIESANLLHESSEYKAWRTTRRAVINTLDSCEAHSKFAEQVVLNYRHGMYYGDIDFHVGSIHAYIEKRLNGTANEPFLQHAILDLPATEEYFDILGRALKPTGTLLTFCPSITQICDGALKARENSAPLWLEKVVEIGGGIGVGGREWDVRPVKPRVTMKTEECLSTITDASNGGNGFVNQNGGWSMICRPKVGSRVVGGGFVAVWRRMADSSYSFVPKAV
jgi:tRNA (adenine57-N1/adenine58-N1)-methyltransferase